MDRIRRIRELESKAYFMQVAFNANRWETAHLYWQENQEGKTRAELGRSAGKSPQHVMYMIRCWESVWPLDVHIKESGEVDYDNLDDFNEVYHSDDVRKPEDRERRSTMPTQYKGSEIRYKGVTMKSHLEENFARHLDGQSTEWKYEPRVFSGRQGRKWLPDFWVDSPEYPDGVWVELKPAAIDAEYIAEQIRRTSVIWESTPGAVVQIIPWEYNSGAAIVITGRSANEWSIRLGSNR